MLREQVRVPGLGQQRPVLPRASPPLLPALHRGQAWAHPRAGPLWTRRSARGESTTRHACAPLPHLTRRPPAQDARWRRGEVVSLKAARDAIAEASKSFNYAFIEW